MILTITQLITLSFGTTLLLFTIYKYKKSQLNIKTFKIWLSISAIFFLVVIFQSNIIFVIVNVIDQDAMDFFLYNGLLIVFFLLFFIYNEIEKLQKQISEIVTKIAIDRHKK